MKSPFASNRLAVASLCGVGLLALAVDSCGPTPTYTRLAIEGTGGVPMHEGTGGSGGQLVMGTGGAVGGTPSGSGGMMAGAGTSAGGADAHGSGGAGTSVGGVPAGGSPGTGGVVATGGAAGGPVDGTGAGTGSIGGGGGGDATSTGGAVASGGTTSGGVTGTAGAGTGGTPAAGGKGGAGAAGGMAGGATGGAGGGFGPPKVVDCSAPSVPPSGLLTDFNRQPAATGRWASSNGLVGTLFAFAADSTSTSTATVGTAPSDLHLVASVGANTYAGGGILFDSCQSIGSFTSIRYSVSGTNSCPIWLQIQTFNLKPNTDVPQGGCASNCQNYPTVQNVPISPSPVTVTLSSFSSWSSTLAGQVVGVFWFLDTLNNKPACTTDLHIDDIKLVP